MPALTDEPVVLYALIQPLLVQLLIVCGASFPPEIPPIQTVRLPAQVKIYPLLVQFRMTPLEEPQMPPE